MALKFKYRDLWYHGKLVPKRVYAQLEDLQRQIDELKSTSANSSEDSGKSVVDNSTDTDSSDTTPASDEKEGS